MPDAFSNSKIKIDTSSNIAPPSISQQSTLTAAKGSGLLFVGTLIQYGIRFILGIVLARFLGAAEYGLYSLTDSIFAITVGISLLGMDTALVYFVSIYAGRQDKKTLWQIIQIGLGVPLAISITAGIIVFISADLVAVTLFNQADLAPLLRVVSFAIPFGVLIAGIVAVTKGFKQMHYKVIVQDVSLSLMKLILTLLLAITGLTALKAMTAYSVATVGACVLLIYLFHRLFPLNQRPDLNREKFKQVARFSFPVYLSRLLDTFGPNLKTMLLGMLNTVASVGVFTVAMRIRMVGLAFHSSIVVMSMPIVSDLYGRKKFEELGRFYRTMTKWTFTFNLPIFLIVLLFPEALLSIFGSSFIVGSTALIILALGDLMNSATGICGVIVTMTGNTWLNTINSVVSLTLNLVLSILLIPDFGVVGVAVATAISVVIVNLLRLMQVFWLFRLLPYDITFVKPVLAGIVAMAVTWVTGNILFNNSGLFAVIFNIGLLLATFSGSILLLGLSQEDKVILQRFGNRLRRRTVISRPGGE